MLDVHKQDQVTQGRFFFFRTLLGRGVGGRLAYAQIFGPFSPSPIIGKFWITIHGNCMFFDNIIIFITIFVVIILLDIICTWFCISESVVCAKAKTSFLSKDLKI